MQNNFEISVSAVPSVQTNNDSGTQPASLPFASSDSGIGGKGICPHGRRKDQCKDCGGSGLCPHDRRKYRCKDCGGKGICPHGRRKSQCKDCGGSGICPHGRDKFRCKDCGGSGICSHGRRKDLCKECRALFERLKTIPVETAREIIGFLPMPEQPAEERYQEGLLTLTESFVLEKLSFPLVSTHEDFSAY